MGQLNVTTPGYMNDRLLVVIPVSDKNNALLNTENQRHMNFSDTIHITNMFTTYQHTSLIHSDCVQCTLYNLHPSNISRFDIDIIVLTDPLLFINFNSRSKNWNQKNATCPRYYHIKYGLLNFNLNVISNL